MNDHLEMQNPFAESFEYIASFFFGDVELIETFNAVCEDMLSIDNELMIRHDASIIGMAKGNQYYRFYLKYIDGQYYIKYKHELKSYLFSPENIKSFFIKNRENYDFFIQKGEKIERKDRSFDNMKNNYVDINEEWGRLRAIVKDSLKTGRQQATPYVIHSTYNGILEIMRCAANRYLKAQRCEILEKRIFTYSPETLRCVAEEFGVSHERIRQLQNSSWKRLSTGIYKGVEFESYRESLKKILMSVPSDMLVSTIRGITLLNQSIGEWLYMIVVEDDETHNQSTL